MTNQIEKIFDEKIRIVHEREISRYLRRRLKLILIKFLTDFDRRFKISSLQELKIEVRVATKEGSKERFEVKSNLFCAEGVFNSRGVGWSLYQTVKKTICSIKNKLFKKNEIKISDEI